MKNKINEKLRREILLAKKFCHAQNVYGAESYVRGFSGYALECLIIYYKSFEKMLKELLKVEEKVIIDPAKHYKKKEEILRELNGGKLKSPVVFIDPTFKERNVLGALSVETFEKFKEAGRKYLKNKNEKFFKKEEINYEKLKEKLKEREEFVKIRLTTNKQEGDIAGSKLLKGFNYVKNSLGKYFDVLNSGFEYKSGNNGEGWIIVKPKNEIIIRGPPISMKKHAEKFKKMHKNFYEEEGTLYSEFEMLQTARQFLKEFSKKNKKQLTEMDIINVEVN